MGWAVEYQNKLFVLGVRAAVLACTVTLHAMVMNINIIFQIFKFKLYLMFFFSIENHLNPNICTYLICFHYCIPKYKCNRELYLSDLLWVFIIPFGNIYLPMHLVLLYGQS
jgi:hypothetical protein